MLSVQSQNLSRRVSQSGVRAMKSSLQTRKFANLPDVPADHEWIDGNTHEDVYGIGSVGATTHGWEPYAQQYYGNDFVLEKHLARTGFVTPYIASSYKNAFREKNFSPYYAERLMNYIDPDFPAVRVAVTNGSGHLAYQLLVRIASGHMFGPKQRVVIHAIDSPGLENKLEGTAAELRDCSFPLLEKIACTTDIREGVEAVDYAIVLEETPESAQGVGKLLGTWAKRNCKVIVSGENANTVALVASQNAANIPVENFSAVSRLQHNRGLAQISQKIGQPVDAISKFCVWGNSSNSAYADLTHANVQGVSINEIVNETDGNFDAWRKEFEKAIVNRQGNALASSAQAATVHFRDLMLGSQGQWVSMGVASNGEYGVDKGLFCSFPVVTSEGDFSIVPDLEISKYSKTRIDKSVAELRKERDAASKYLPQ